MKFNHDILFEFIPDEDKKSFQVWDNVFITTTTPNSEKSHNVIVATYRAPFEERVFIPLNDYYAMRKQKERDNKLNNLVC